MSFSSLKSSSFDLRSFFRKLPPATLFVSIIFVALIFFELFNYSTTDYALRDLLGDLKFAGISWATILAIAFCGIDFAGIARLFSPQSGNERNESWYLFGAWLLAATMNAGLTWWGVAMAIANHTVQSSTVIDPTTVTKVVPVFVAIMVWVIRILIIGSLSVASDRFFNNSPRRAPVSNNNNGNINPSAARPRPLNAPLPAANPTMNAAHMSPRPHTPRPIIAPEPPASTAGRAEPTYHSLSMKSNNNNNGGSEVRRM